MERGREGKSNGREKRKYQETKKRSIEKWKIEDASTEKKMTAKIRRENSRMTYQRIQRENDIEKLKRRTRNAGENIDDYKRETKCKRIKDRSGKRVRRI